MSSEPQRSAPSQARSLQSGWTIGLAQGLLLGVFGLWRDAPPAAVLSGLCRYAAWGLLGAALLTVVWYALGAIAGAWRGRPAWPALALDRALAAALVAAWSLFALRIALRTPGPALAIPVAGGLLALLLAWSALRRHAGAIAVAGTRKEIAAAMAACALALLILLAPPSRGTDRVPGDSDDASRPLEVLRPAAITALRGEQPLDGVLLITIDTLRADRLGCYGYDRATSPAIDWLAERGVRFDQALCQRPKTSPSVATLLTGSYPIRHGIHTPKRKLGDANLTLAEMLRDEGFRCAASVTNGNLYPVFAFDQGFESYAYGHKDAATGVDKAIEWLDQSLGAGESYFFWLHLTDPHWPYEPDPPFDTAFGDGTPEDLYDGEIAYTDAQLQRLFAWLDEHPRLRDRTLVVFTADHGESMGEHVELYEHGLHGYEEAARVPLILAAPGRLPAGEVRAAPLGLVDVLPTILDALGLNVPDGVQGSSALPLALGLDESGPRAYVYLEAGYGEHIGPGRTRILRRHDSKSIFRLREWAWAPASPMTLLHTIDAALEGALAPDEFYDLRDDPGERRNLRGTRAADVRRDRAWVRHFTRELARDAHDASALDASTLDAQTYESLKSLGYID